MHEWHTRANTNILSLIDEFLNYEFNTDYSGRCNVERVRILDRVLKTEEEAINCVTKSSYGGNTAYLIAYTSKPLTKGYLNAFAAFKAKREDYLNFSNNLTIAYGRKSSKVTCPHCSSSINLSYGKYFKVCPICGSRKIISDSNWKALNTKKAIMEKAAKTLSEAAIKSGVTFLCGIEWHC